MTATTQSPSPAARVAAPGEGVSLAELQLAARNSGLPLEALRYEITPLGLHYLLTHYDIPYVDPVTWRLTVGGRVERPFEVDLPALRSRSAVTRAVTLECAGNGRAALEPRPVSQPWLNEAVGTMRWTGTPLAPLLEEAGVLDGAVEVVFTGADRGLERGVEQTYARSLPLAEALREEVMLVWAVNDVDLPPQHGAPVRLVVPGWYGMAHVKWLRSVELVDRPFEGYQQATAYRIKEDPAERGEPVTRIRPRALMVPPGVPDFMSRTRFVDAGEVLLAGRAWSGQGEVVGVDVSTDDGATWQEAELGPAGDRWAWRAWVVAWDAAPGTHHLRCRARDASGAVQPLQQAWNVQGMANNSAQRVAVVVR
ncbi:sulfite oxidase [Vallicoccus soli]|uniref:Sulfite oxidase n=1 Tax=Vallicoccus soli TaxID=2339232 RepID=A0A3A3ZKQ2_9ACTN|nr:sulfite oxidase [Vallicoccus soli]RJK96460.1 sulfite oxidase [Vallicoccus soli]